MIANPAISAGGFPGSGTGNQGAKRVVQDGLLIDGACWQKETHVHNGLWRSAPVGCAGDLLYQTPGICPNICANSDEKSPGDLHGEFLCVRGAHDALMRSSYWHNVRVRPLVVPPAC